MKLPPTKEDKIVKDDNESVISEETALKMM